MLRVLIVCSGNKKSISPFVKEQVDELIRAGLRVDVFPIKGKGLVGYLKNLFRFWKKIGNTTYDLVNAHYGLSGLLAGLQWKLPVVVTYHGTDLYSTKVRFYSKLAQVLSKKSIVVSPYMLPLLRKNNAAVIPCGVDFTTFFPMDKSTAKKKLNLSLEKKYILFSSAFDIDVKNYPLAQKAVDQLNDDSYELIELKGYNRDEVALLMNAAELALLTSFSEGSPQFIKEAMACNCPIVSTNVGDVKDVIANTKGCYLTSFELDDVSKHIAKAIDFNGKTDGRNRISHLQSDVIATKIIEVYETVVR
ncbi:glycosyltransferase family 4 protein [Marinifilum caeruleilacunae]|uniref:Glycosyltransferase n=1 Tax=Marinifilum caeruleilacunae TaxID=2499076 RepID=A0ABX1WQU5_9BACT|nr:glycosyltransferase family 4 protein [Marinifilum caeruleilacunae]NOU58416.1 glycosyltransferase [Marinifilum caeruleilacunae]